MTALFLIFAISFISLILDLFPNINIEENERREREKREKGKKGG